MGAILSRIGKRIKMTFKNFRSDCSFSFRYACLRVGDDLGGRIGLHKFSEKCRISRENWIFKYLKTNLNSVITEYKNRQDESVFDENSPIWICWWTGEGTAPDLVKQCMKSIKTNAKARPVVLIDKNNYSQYIDIPQYMTEKIQKGQMGFAHLSDYIRASLLYKYGGLWLDATIFCSKEIPMEYFEYPFFTCRSSYDTDCRYISKLRWVTFVLGGWKNNIIYSYLKSAFEEYWKNEKYAIDYLFFDYLIDLAYQEIPTIKQLIDDVPVNNIHRDNLQAAMNDALPAEKFDSIINAETVLYKLSWRETYSLKTAEDKDSVYSHFLNMKFN